MQQEAYQKQEKVSQLSFLTEVPNFILILISAILSQSLLVWLDLIDSLGNILSEGIMTVQSHKMRRDLRYEYNYGVGKIEAMTAFFASAIKLVGLVCVVVVSVVELFHPEKPSDMLIYVVVLKVANVATDAWFLWQQAKIRKLHSSAMTESEFTANIGYLAFDAGTLLSLLVVWLLRDSKLSWYVSPVLSLGIGIVMVYFCFKNIRDAVTELMDKTLPEEQQMQILKVLNRHNGEYSRFESIRSRCTGGSVTVDLVISFDENTTFGQIQQLRDAVQRDLEGEIPNCQVSIVVA